MASEMNFTNLFMWRDFYNFEFFEINEMICLIASPKGQEPFAYAPIGSYTPERFRSSVNAIREYFSEKEWRLVFRRVEESKLEYFERYTDGQIKIEYDRDNSDYIYLTENLINLKGRKYHSKRNHINIFLKTYEYEYVELNESYIEEALRIDEEWNLGKEDGGNGIMYPERLANREVLKNFAKLDCKGALIKVNGKFEAYTVGEIINNRYAVIHIEKANSSIKGIYAFINQKFCEYELRNILYVNREQDLGIESLRRAKKSYNPIKYINKYNIYVN
ncbi:MAG TPA: DUF2156 domain-containing protein [Ruminiclostridium sp.]|jgi:hypothetical protein|uniref:Phosphatidylglycerol lysyltransferase C-terminal domain-containing protein n=3 Tax=Acetivibrio saccincola TaxID=1677857 RepID=A0A2K9EDW1_9FIRM|nr:phosphatidylglycerol lysyltransferase domain-containing protein [Acetivibrio saccincola]AUG58324.1 hypothetical protein HVS_12235 [Acetivibrio saccincola]NLW27275.1 DUF2156 domain-containing protein [Acetivibrio saccincola]HAA43643.1 DUF2156 domain-containing protein [Ruminiclostridium sp.]HOA96600.1 phosphatidylglycerol lysyltransferase domain-containing protein [Acetivibrio saccincola]